MQTFRDLATGTKLMLVCGSLLFLSLFFTWQELVIDFGPAGTSHALLDGWDRWGLLIGLVSLGLVSLVVIVYLTEVELSDEVPWELLIVGLGTAAFTFTAIKNVTDADSALVSYVAVLIAAMVALGAYENWAAAVGRASVLERLLRRRRRVSSVV